MTPNITLNPQFSKNEDSDDVLPIDSTLLQQYSAEILKQEAAFRVCFQLKLYLNMKFFIDFGFLANR